MKNIDGLKTDKVKFNVKKSGTYKFKINDFITEQKYAIEIVVSLYEAPILEESMIPVNIQNEVDIMKCTNLDEQWYNYNDLENINLDDYKSISITSGASTPGIIVNEVINKTFIP